MLKSSIMSDSRVMRFRSLDSELNNEDDRDSMKIASVLYNSSRRVALEGSLLPVGVYRNSGGEGNLGSL